MRRWRSFASELVPEQCDSHSGTVCFLHAKFERIELSFQNKSPNLLLSPRFSRKAGAFCFLVVEASTDIVHRQ